MAHLVLLRLQIIAIAFARRQFDRNALDELEPALREAIDEGFRGTVASNGWPLAVDPYLESLRGEPEFQAMVSALDNAVNVMHERVIEAEESGNWDELRALVERT